MNRWSARLRRAASTLLGVHLLQVVLLAASAACDLSATGNVGAPSLPVVRQVAAHHAGAQHGEAPAASDHSSHANSHGDSHRDSDLDSHHDSHHDSHTTNCPMAMACAATAVATPVQQLTVAEVHVSSDRIAHESRVLRSLHLAPEPPPPRG